MELQNEAFFRFGEQFIKTLKPLILYIFTKYQLNKETEYLDLKLHFI